ncbi:MAG: dodecin domain-containing protein [Gammaproteobacteria bacterium]|nr:dodecin domain-containing protein [Gammaproteobacteria bacterium]
MTVSSVSTLTASSPESWQDALVRGIARARKTLRGIHKVEVIAERALVERGEIKSYEVEPQGAVRARRLTCAANS